MSDSVQPHRWQPTRLPHPWDSPGKNTGVVLVVQFSEKGMQKEVKPYHWEKPIVLRSLAK